MRKNEAGLTILEIGDVIRKGNGRVHYTVTWVPEEHLYGTVQIEVKSHASERLSRTNVETAVLVQSVQSVAYTAGCSVEELFPPVDADDANEDEAPVKETSAYAKAVLFALNALQKHVYAGTVSKTKKAKTRRLNRRQKASRKANR